MEAETLRAVGETSGGVHSCLHTHGAEKEGPGKVVCCLQRTEEQYRNQLKVHPLPHHSVSAMLPNIGDKIRCPAWRGRGDSSCPWHVTECGDIAFRARVLSACPPSPTKEVPLTASQRSTPRAWFHGGPSLPLGIRPVPLGSPRSWATCDPPRCCMGPIPGSQPSQQCSLCTSVPCLGHL